MILQENNQGYLEGDVFKTIIKHTPLVSVDLIVKDNDKVLLGKRSNAPAKEYWFTLGGRVLKNEHISDAITRIAMMELGIALFETPLFIGVFEHLYPDSIFEGVSTHYVNLAYEIKLSHLTNLPKEQHDEYCWFTLEELFSNNDVHPYVKDYFTKEKGTIPQNKGEINE